MIEQARSGVNGQKAVYGVVNHDFRVVYSHAELAQKFVSA